MNILFVSTGNTCISVMAEAILRDMAQRYALPINVASAGLAVTQGLPPTHDCAWAMREMGLDVTEHRAQCVDAKLMAWADMVICMLDKHRFYLVDLYPEYWPKITMLPHSITSPFGQTLSAYRVTVNELRVLLLQWIKHQHFC